MIALPLCLLFVLAACASHGGYEIETDGTIDPYGFFSGIWHGLLFPFALVFKVVLWCIKGVLWIIYLASGVEAYLYLQYVDIYLVGQPNTGLFYYVGYLIGLSWISGL